MQSLVSDKGVQNHKKKFSEFPSLFWDGFKIKGKKPRNWPGLMEEQKKVLLWSEDGECKMERKRDADQKWPLLCTNCFSCEIKTKPEKEIMQWVDIIVAFEMRKLAVETES